MATKKLSFTKKIYKKFSKLRSSDSRNSSTTSNHDSFKDTAVDITYNVNGSFTTNDADADADADESQATCPQSQAMYTDIQATARNLLSTEPLMATLLRKTVLHPTSTTLEKVIARTIAARLLQSCGSNPMCCIEGLTKAFVEALEKSESGANASAREEELVLGHTIIEAIRMDLNACFKRDPACESILEVLLFYKGFACLVCHRVARSRWMKTIPLNRNYDGKKARDELTNQTHPSYSNRLSNSSDTTVKAGKSNRIRNTTQTRYVSLWLQSQASAAFGIDIHPGATIGAAVMLDHGTGIVIGETAVVGDYCTFLHGVTLGGTGKASGDRHPKVGSGVLIGTNASILGNIKIGDNAKIGAGSVVLKPIPHSATAVGAPARIIGFVKEQRPSLSMDTSMKNVIPIGGGKGTGGGSEGSSASSTSSSDSDSESESNTNAVKNDDNHLLDRRRRLSTTSTINSNRSSLLSYTSIPEEVTADIEAEQDKEGVDIDAEKHVKDTNIKNTLAEKENTPKKDDDEMNTKEHSVASTRRKLKKERRMSVSSMTVDCPFRSFRCRNLPQGAISYGFLSSLLERNCTEDEAGEIYMGLLKLNPDKKFIPGEVFVQEFSSIAEKYSNLSQDDCNTILLASKSPLCRSSSC